MTDEPSPPEPRVQPDRWGAREGSEVRKRTPEQIERRRRRNVARRARFKASLARRKADAANTEGTP